MRPNAVTIDSSNALAALQAEARRGGPRRFTAFAVVVPKASDAVNAGWRQRIERDYFACGCGIGTAASLVALAGGVAALAVRPGGWAVLGWVDGLLLLCLFVVATGAGKLVGIRLARHRLLKTLSELAALFPPSPAEAAGQQRRRPCSVHG